MSKTWILIANNKDANYVAETAVEPTPSGESNPKLVYRAICKWIIRGGASEMLADFWEYIDQYNNKLEDAFLDQLYTQAESTPEDLQTTNVRTKDYSIDMTVKANLNKETIKSCKVTFVLYIYFEKQGKHVKVDEQEINITMIQAGTGVEKISVKTELKTPAHGMKKPNKTVRKRSSKLKVTEK